MIEFRYLANEEYDKVEVNVAEVMEILKLFLSNENDKEYSFHNLESDYLIFFSFPEENRNIID